MKFTEEKTDSGFKNEKYCCTGKRSHTVVLVLLIPSDWTPVCMFLTPKTYGPTAFSVFWEYISEKEKYFWPTSNSQGIRYNHN
jgi:hypothetical protein